MSQDYSLIASEIHEKGFSYLPFKLNKNLLEKINKKSNQISDKMPLEKIVQRQSYLIK